MVFLFDMDLPLDWKITKKAFGTPAFEWDNSLKVSIFSESGFPVRYSQVRLSLKAAWDFNSKTLRSSRDGVLLLKLFFSCTEGAWLVFPSQRLRGLGSVLPSRTCQTH